MKSKLKHLRRLKHIAPLRCSLFTQRGEGNSSRRSLPTNCHEPFITMKLIPLLLFAGWLAVSAETEEQINKRFAVHPSGKLVADVAFGSTDISLHAGSD